MGGENGRLHGLDEEGAGSSPRGRGKPHRPGFHGRDGRLIPAWAGKTSVSKSSTDGTRAHPRVGGENRDDGDRAAPDAGSSPRGRGKPGTRVSGSSQAGLIPAWAGKTRARQGCPRTAGAHPRVGGENGYTPGRDIYHFGSSPRGRGKPILQGRGVCAGRAHPRVGGENGPRWAQ